MHGEGGESVGSAAAVQRVLSVTYAANSPYGCCFESGSHSYVCTPHRLGFRRQMMCSDLNAEKSLLESAAPLPGHRIPFCKNPLHR